MAKQEKLLRRISAKPKDFTWSELASPMKSLDSDMEISSGSGRKFILKETGATLFIHEPHPAKVLKSYQVRDVIDFLKRTGILK